jgi:hypothetical protein
MLPFKARAEKIKIVQPSKWEEQGFQVVQYLRCGYCNAKLQQFNIRNVIAHASSCHPGTSKAGKKVKDCSYNYLRYLLYSKHPFLSFPALLV